MKSCLVTQCLKSTKKNNRCRLCTRNQLGHCHHHRQISALVFSEASLNEYFFNDDAWVNDQILYDLKTKILDYIDTSINYGILSIDVSRVSLQKWWSERTRRRVDASDKICLFVNLRNSHWALLTNIMSKSLTYGYYDSLYDSLPISLTPGTTTRGTPELVNQIVNDYGIFFEERSLKQKNYSDCGIFAIFLLLSFLLGRRFDKPPKRIQFKKLIMLIYKDKVVDTSFDKFLAENSLEEILF